MIAGREEKPAARRRSRNERCFAVFCGRWHFGALFRPYARGCLAGATGLAETLSMPIRFKPGRSTRPAVQDDFFIPELCEAEALFTLVLLAELLVLVLVLEIGRAHV